MQNTKLTESNGAVSHAPVAMESLVPRNDGAAATPTDGASAATSDSVATFPPFEVNGEVIAEALRLAAREIPVVACYGILANAAGTRCTCSKPESCKAKGKHPIGAGGFKAATCDVDEINQMFDGMMPCNLAIRTGAESGLVVLDCDKRNQGEFTLKQYEAEHGPLPKTPIALTGDGRHYYFKHPGGSLKSKPIMKGLDIKADGGMVIAPPSRHKSGRDYRWERGLSIFECEPAPLPEPLRAMVMQKVRATADRSTHGSSEDGTISEGGRHDFILREAGRLRRNRCELADLERFLLELNESRCMPPLEDEEVLRIAKDIAEKPAGPLTARSTPGYRRLTLASAPWQEALVHSDKGVLLGTLANATTILGNDERWEDVLVYDEFAQCIEKSVPAPWHEHDKPSSSFAHVSNAWTDEDTSRTCAWLAREYGLRVSVDTVHRAVKVVAERNPTHPVRNYLSALRWDGVSRIDTWLTTYLGVAPSPYVRLVGRCWLISAVARIMHPGCKVDHVMILEGVQGLKKSTALRVLAGDRYFIDTSFDVGNKDAFMQIRKAWIVELAELATLSRAEAARAKQFFTSSVDTYRPPYGHEVISVPRHQVFAGTVNEDEYLKDDTGNRRYWPVMVGSIDIEALERDRDQIWAEATNRWRDGERWYPVNDGENELCFAEQEKRLIGDPWRPIIETWLVNTGVTTVSTVDVLVKALNMSHSSVSRMHSVRAANVLRQLGGVRRQARQADGTRVWVYDLPPNNRPVPRSP